MLKDWFCSKAFWYNLGSFPKLPGGRDGEMGVLEDYKPKRVNCFLLCFFLTGGTLKFKWNFLDLKINKWMLNTLFSFQKVYMEKFKSSKLPAVVREQMIMVFGKETILVRGFLLVILKS